MKPRFDNQTILITGVCGTIGKALLQELLDSSKFNPRAVIGIDNNESELFFLESKYKTEKRFSFYISDVRDVDDLERRMVGVNLVIHAAAYKHVVMCEKSPDQAISANIIGVQNVISASRATGVSKVIFTSSDKAVNPTNVMGTSKLMGERMITAANIIPGGPIFASTRFGNVLGSNGSVLEIFINQIKNKQPITITDLDMSRFIMSPKEAVTLVLDSANRATGGEVFVTKMPVVTIINLAESLKLTMAQKYDIKTEDCPINVIGSKPGEKLYEELLSDEELKRTVELDKFFCVYPALTDLYETISPDSQNQEGAPDRPYISKDEVCLSVHDITNYLIDHSLLP